MAHSVAIAPATVICIRGQCTSDASGRARWAQSPRKVAAIPGAGFVESLTRAQVRSCTAVILVKRRLRRRFAGSCEQLRPGRPVYALRHDEVLACMTRRVVHAADRWLAAECGVAAVVVVGMEKVC